MIAYARSAGISGTWFWTSPIFRVAFVAILVATALCGQRAMIVAVRARRTSGITPLAGWLTAAGAGLLVSDYPAARVAGRVAFAGSPAELCACD